MIFVVNIFSSFVSNVVFSDVIKRILGVFDDETEEEEEEEEEEKEVRRQRPQKRARPR
jgi:Mg2+/Co2+ transporter CorC